MKKVIVSILGFFAILSFFNIFKNFDLEWLIFTIIFGLYPAYYVKEKQKRNKELKIQREIYYNEQQRLLDLANNQNILYPINPRYLPVNIILQQNELIYHFKNVKLFEEKQVRISQSRGGSVILIKGVYTKSGTTISKYSHSNWANIDIGILILTSNRLIFTGQMRTIEYKS